MEFSTEDIRLLIERTYQTLHKESDLDVGEKRALEEWRQFSLEKQNLIILEHFCNIIVAEIKNCQFSSHNKVLFAREAIALFSEAKDILSPEMLSTPIARVSFPASAKNKLTRSLHPKISTLGDLLALSIDEFLSIRQLGAKGILDITDTVQQLLVLRNNP